MLVRGLNCVQCKKNTHKKTKKKETKQKKKNCLLQVRIQIGYEKMYKLKNFKLKDSHTFQCIITFIVQCFTRHAIFAHRSYIIVIQTKLQ